MMNCSRLLKRCLFAFGVLAFSVFLGGSRLLSSSASAVSVGTSGFDLYYRTGTSGSYSWRNGLAYGFGNGLAVGRNYSVQRYQFNTASLTSGGNHASIHFETNIVSTVPNASYSSDFFVNLPQQTIITCVGAGGFSGTSAISKNLSYAVTRNWSSTNGSNTTLTLYGDVTLENITPNVTGTFTCMIGSDFDFYVFPSNSAAVSGKVWFEQNPISISWSTNKTDSLLETQNNLLNQQIQQQQQTNNLLDQQVQQQQEQNDYLTDDSPPDVDVSDLADTAGWLPAGPVDSILTIPITFLNGIIGALTSDNCNPVTLPLPFVGGNLTLPCMRPILNEMGFLTIFNVVGGAVAMFIIYDTLKWLYKFVDDTLTFRENNTTIWGGL